jgi:site-specific recombinase XerD
MSLRHRSSRSDSDYLERCNIKLSRIHIEQIDAFCAELNPGFSQQTGKIYRTYIRGFLKYLYQQRKILKRDLAPLVVGPHTFSRVKPPTFLRSHEVQRLFAGLKFSTAGDLRTYAMIHLVYTLGLRPKEICLITLDDISFRKGELSLRERKAANPIKLPLPEETIKAIAAYLIGARPKSKHRELFLSLRVPYQPIRPYAVYYTIKRSMRKAGLPPGASAYWLRHTYAQNLLESGVSLYEIKEMLGHDCIESTRKYLHIHISLMRGVLFDETL